MIAATSDEDPALASSEAKLTELFEFRLPPEVVNIYCPLSGSRPTSVER